MAIFHMAIKNAGRGNGKSAVAGAAYRSGQKLFSEEDGKIKDYSRIADRVEHSAVYLCENAPTEYNDIGVLWNAVHKEEKAVNARLYREFEAAIPKEFNRRQRIEVVGKFCQSLADEGMCVQEDIHNDGKGNPHFHAMATVRPINENGNWSAKEKKVYSLDEDGNRIAILNEDGTQKQGRKNDLLWKREKVLSVPWEGKDKYEIWRERWAAICNEKLAEIGSDERIDHRSFERQGIKYPPTKKEGWRARQIERQGGISPECKYNREIVAVRPLSIEIEGLEKELRERRLLEEAERRLFSLYNPTADFVPAMEPLSAEPTMSSAEPLPPIAAAVIDGVLMDLIDFKSREKPVNGAFLENWLVETQTKINPPPPGGDGDR